MHFDYSFMSLPLCSIVQSNQEENLHSRAPPPRMNKKEHMSNILTCLGLPEGLVSVLPDSEH